MTQTIFFYDLETTGRFPREDRVMQFAGQRTDMNLNPIGDPVNILVKTPNDTLPSPIAVSITHITPQSTLDDGLTEAEFASFLTKEIFTPNTIIMGYNSVRFDDEFLRHLFWRNFYDPYEWQWKDGRSRWDLLDFVRITRALRPEGINWPLTKDGRPTNRLELITKMNNISHEHAHDALADVFATIAVAKLIREKQPQLFDYMLSMRNKNLVRNLVNLDTPKLFVYASGRYYGVGNFTTVAYPVAPSKNGNILVYNLRYDPEIISKEIAEFKELTKNLSDNDRKEKAKLWRETGKHSSWYPIVKELCYNKCPAVAPISVLDSTNDEGQTGWDKIEISTETVQHNLEILQKHPELIREAIDEAVEEKDWGKPFDVESSLYDGFVPDSDKVRINAVRNADANTLADFHPNFADARLEELLIHYKAKNFPTSLDAHETEEWEKYRISRLKHQEPTFLAELEELEKRGDEDYIVEELKLWYQSLAPEY